MDATSKVIRPFTPEEAKSAKVLCIPDEVIEAVNELLAENYSSRITLTQKEIETRVLGKMQHLSAKDLYDNKYMDFEEVFRKAGWDVSFDRPGYCENYKPFFVFTPRRGQR